MNNQTLIAKYLDLIQEQEKIINELNKSNNVLSNRNADLKRQNALYKENILHWKGEHDKLQEGLIEIKVKCVSVYERNALNIYAENQRS